MSSDIHAKVDTSRKIRFTKKEPDNRTEWVEREVNIDESAEDVAEEGMVSLPQGEDQQVHSPPAANKSPARSAKLCKMVLWILILCVIITLAVYLSLEIIKVKKSNSHQQAKLLGKWCPDGWTRFGCSCYFKFEDKKMWYESRIQCQDRGADLVVIDSPDEQEFVKELNDKGESWIGIQRTWIRAKGTYEWGWVDGSPLTQTFWAEGWPRKDSYWEYATCCNDEGKWTHKYYTNPNSWICEK
uniref:CD209 antigen-like protein E n=1 Tax=Fundulus heteroclitus TaxID=8078 RepID=A0A3Q2UJ80_FUNHE